jgi:hypothetical protein
LSYPHCVSSRKSGACDFAQTYDLFFRTVFLFFIIDHDSRRVSQVGVARTSTDEWVAPQVREATPFGESQRKMSCVTDDNPPLNIVYSQATLHSSL